MLKIWSAKSLQLVAALYVLTSASGTYILTVSGKYWNAETLSVGGVVGSIIISVNTFAYDRTEAPIEVVELGNVKLSILQLLKLLSLKVVTLPLIVTDERPRQYDTKLVGIEVILLPRVIELSP